MFEVKLCDVGTLQKPFLTRQRHVNTCAAKVIRSFNSWRKILEYWYTLTRYNQKQKIHTINKNGLQMCKSTKVCTDLVFFCCFIRAHWDRHTKWMHRTGDKTRIFVHSAHHILLQFFTMKEYPDQLIEEKWRKRDEFANSIYCRYRETYQS